MKSFMKKRYYTAMLLLGVLLSGCDNEFLDTSPKEGIGSNNMWITEDDAKLGVVAIYNSVRTKLAFNMYGFNDCFTPLAWCVNGTGTTFDEYRQYKLCINTATASESIFKEKWTTLYKGVARANDAIDHLPNMNIDENTKKTLLAEAKFCRALFYFDLLSFYSGHDQRDPGVPLYTTVTNYQDAYLPRSKPAQVRAQMIKDLTEAIPDLPFTSSEAGRANSAAAQMLLGKVYLYNEQWEKAAAAFGAVVTQNEREQKYELYPDYYLLFQLDGEDNKEGIFIIPNLDIQDYGSFMMMIYGTRSSYAQGGTVCVPAPYLVDSYQKKDGSAFSWNDVPAAADQDAFWNSKTEVDKVFADRDPRLEASIIRPWALYEGAYNSTKKSSTYEYRPATYTGTSEYMALSPNNNVQTYIWRKFVNTGNQCPIRRNAPIDIPVMRYADLLLLFAEAKNEAEGPVDSVYWAINKVRQRPSVEMPPLSGLGKTEMRQAIRNERAWELAGEGHSFNDYRRWYKYDSSYDINTKLNYRITGFNTNNYISDRVFTERNWQFAIPQEEIDMNRYLTQYPGWEN